MKAAVWMGPGEVRVAEVPEPRLVNPRDVIVKVRLSAISGADMAPVEAHAAQWQPGEVLGHEFMGEVASVGSEVHGLPVGSRVVVSSNISCGRCWYCREGQFSLCDNATPHAPLAEAKWGASGAGIFGAPEALGGYPGGHAEYVRVPFADVGLFAVPDGVLDEQALFVSSGLPSAYAAVEAGAVGPGSVVAVWGCGALGQFAIRSALLLGASRVIAIDRSSSRLQLATRAPGVEALGFGEVDDLTEVLGDLTGGRGPDVCIDAWSDGCGELGARHRRLARLAAIDHDTQDVECSTIMRQMARACRKGGTISTIGVHAATIDAFPAAMMARKGLTFRAGRGNPQRHAKMLLQCIADGKIDPAVAVTRRLRFEDAANAFTAFKHTNGEHVAVVLVQAR